MITSCEAKKRKGKRAKKKPKKEQVTLTELELCEGCFTFHEV